LTVAAESFFDAASGLGFLLSLAIVFPGATCIIVPRRGYKGVDGRVKPGHDARGIRFAESG
jgi:hypothetical protein